MPTKKGEKIPTQTIKFKSTLTTTLNIKNDLQSVAEMDTNAVNLAVSMGPLWLSALFEKGWEKKCIVREKVYSGVGLAICIEMERIPLKKKLKIKK